MIFIVQIKRQAWNISILYVVTEHVNWPPRIFFKDFIYLFIFRERGREGERKGGKH